MVRLRPELLSIEPPAARSSGWRRRLASIRVKAAVLFALVAVLPAAFVEYRLSRANRRAVEDSEQNLQAAVLAEIAALVHAELESTTTDVQAVARALSLAAAAPRTGDGLAAVRALLATRLHVDACRLEVPSAGVDTVLSREGRAALAPPRSTAELRQRADRDGMARGWSDTALAIVVRIEGAGQVPGYVTASIRPGVFESGIRDFAQNRFEGNDACVVIANEARRVVASRCAAGYEAGASVAAHPMLRQLPDGAPADARVGLISEYSENQRSFVGGVETIAPLGWTVLTFRPKEHAYRVLSRLRQESALVGVIVVIAASTLALLAATTITRPILKLSRQTRRIAARRWAELEFDQARHDEIGDLARGLEFMAKSLQSGEREIAREARLRGDLSRFLSRELVEVIVSGEHSLALGGQRGEVSVLFADVVGFTPLAESRPAEEVVLLLNELFSLLSEIVFRHGGTVDKFLGDCIMAVWGAPVPQEDHARRAVAAAEDMLQFLETANLDWRKRLGLEIRLAIGINSGEAIIGNIGSTKRMEYTVIGDTVNVASRLEALAQANQILVGERTHELLGGVGLRPLGEQLLFGRRNPVRVYQAELE